MRNWRSVLPGFKLGLIGFAAFILGACQTSSTLFAADPWDDQPTSALSDYIAGQQARLDRDTEKAADFYLAALTYGPENSVLLRDRAYQMLISDGRFDEARDVAKELSPGSLSYNLSKTVRALEYVKSKRYGKAREALDQVNGTGFDLLLKPLALAWSHAGSKDAAAALDALKKLEKHRAFSGFLAEHKGMILAYLGNWDEAEEVFATAFTQPGLLSSRGIIDYAARLSQDGRFEEAINAVDQVLARAPNVLELRRARDRLAMGESFGPYSTTPAAGVAEALYRTATELVRKPTATSAVLYARLGTYLRPEFHAAHILIADVYAAQGRTQTALQTLNALEGDSAFATIVAIREASYLDQLDRREDGIAALKLAIAGGMDERVVRVSLADLLRRNSDFPAAIEVYDTVIADLPNADWTLFYGRGIAHEQNGDFASAEQDLRKALSLNADDPFVLNYLGYSMLDRKVNVPEAIEMIDKAVASRPNDGFIVDSQGWAAFMVGDYERAVELLERAVSLQPGDPTINDHLGDAYWKVGRAIEARFKWQQVLNMDPTDAQRTTTEAKLDLGLTLVESTASPQVATR